MQVHFNNSFVIVGCSTTNYLLEKSRVVAPNNGERNYHIMYQLCAGGSKHYPEFGLQSSTFFKCLVRGEVTTIEGNDDEAEFDTPVKAMGTLGFSKEEQKQIFGIVATVCHLGQIEFQDAEEGDGSKVATGVKRGSVSGRRRSSTVSTGDLSSLGLKTASDLLGVEVSHSEERSDDRILHSTTTNYPSRARFALRRLTRSPLPLPTGPS